MIDSIQIIQFNFETDLDLEEIEENLNKVPDLKVSYKNKNHFLKTDYKAFQMMNDPVFYIRDLLLPIDLSIKTNEVLKKNILFNFKKNFCNLKNINSMIFIGNKKTFTPLHLDVLQDLEYTQIIIKGKKRFLFAKNYYKITAKDMINNNLDQCKVVDVGEGEGNIK
jgi:hypothetical protein